MITFLCDVHMPIKLCKFLIAKGYKATHVNQILEKSSTADNAISQYADTYDLIVITKDADFRNSYFLKKSLRKLIRICLGNLPNNELILLLESHLIAIERLNESSAFYLEINRDSVVVFD